MSNLNLVSEWCVEHGVQLEPERQWGPKCPECDKEYVAWLDALYNATCLYCFMGLCEMHVEDETLAFTWDRKPCACKNPVHHGGPDWNDPRNRPSSKSP